VAGGVTRHCKPINAPDSQPCVVRRVTFNQ
jgi:hypothetical protein